MANKLHHMVTVYFAVMVLLL